MRTDEKELEIMLELAARAARKAGMIVYYDNQDKVHNQYDVDGGIRPWLPTADDGDAHRLGVRLRINVFHSDDAVTAGSVATKGNQTTLYLRDHGDNRDEVTRLVIFMSAVEIGRAIESYGQAPTSPFEDDSPSTSKPCPPCPRCESTETTPDYDVVNWGEDVPLPQGDSFACLSCGHGWVGTWDSTVTEKIRTHFLDPNLNTPHYPSCCVCGKKCGDTEYKVWSGNYLEAVHPNDVEKYNLERGSESGPCALIDVGPECVKKIPEEFRVRFRKS